MTSAWLDTELETYERHVELDTVGQAAAIRAAIRLAAMTHQPKSFLYLGCAGGNGLEALGSARILGLDFNEAYLAKARERWGREFVQCDLNKHIPGDATFDLAFGALIFEYIEDLEGLIRRLARRVNGHLVALILATRENAPTVSESPYREALLPVGQEFRYLSVEAFIETAVAAGFVLEQRNEIPLPAGKYFVSITLQRRL